MPGILVKEWLEYKLNKSGEGEEGGDSSSKLLESPPSSPSPPSKPYKMISIIMGSTSDLPVMQDAADVLDELGLEYEVDIISAHRTPDYMFEFAKQAHKRGVKVIIAGAGGAAHLPGMVASLSPLPIIGVPVKSSNSIDGWDSILSILQMPNGVPVATVALNAAKNAGILAAQIIGSSDEKVRERMVEFKEKLKEKVNKSRVKLEKP